MGALRGWGLGVGVCECRWLSLPISLLSACSGGGREYLYHIITENKREGRSRGRQAYIHRYINRQGRQADRQAVSFHCTWKPVRMMGALVDFWMVRCPSRTC